MLRLDCPFCGPRDEIEFRHGGEAHIVRPEDPAALADDAWAAYLFMRDNPMGVGAERWQHVAGCRLWFNVLRDTVSHRIVAVYAMGDPPPERGR